MKRIFSGRDEIRFDESARAAAEEVAAALPEIRKKGEEIAKCEVPGSIFIVISERLPHTYHIYRIRPFRLIFLVAVFLLALSYPFWSLATTGIIIYLGFVYWLYVFRTLQAHWKYAGGWAISGPGFKPAIALHWPWPERAPAMAALALPRTNPEALRMVLAHEYAHCLLGAIREGARVIAWLDEGFAFWFMEQATGLDAWKPESRTCVEEPEPKDDPRLVMKITDEGYIRLMARYYWEVKGLAEEGKLLEALTASKRDLAGLRPKLHKDE